MFLTLVLSSVAAGIIATLVMALFLYLPLLWGGDYYDVMGALGSALSGQLNGRSRLIGAVIYFGGGIIFALLYGWAVLAFLQSGAPIPEIIVFSNMPVEINLFYPLLGIVLGLGHGILIALLLTIIVIEHHPLERFRSRYILVISQLISHVAFGATVMFFHSQFLQLLLGRAGV